MRRNQLIWLGFAAIALFFLLAEHRAHLLGALPYLLLLACPLLHMMHGGHGHGGHGHGRHESSQKKEAGRDRDDRPANHTEHRP